MKRHDSLPSGGAQSSWRDGRQAWQQGEGGVVIEVGLGPRGNMEVGYGWVQEEGPGEGVPRRCLRQALQTRGLSQAENAEWGQAESRDGERHSKDR